MISKSTKLLAAACVAVLAGCNAVEDVREQPFTPVPPQGVVLQGKVTGPLGTRRSVNLVNNGNNDNGRSITATLGVTETPFTFGIFPVGSTYNVTIRSQPFGKICTVTGGQGTITTPEALNIVVNCVNDPAIPRYNIKVAVPSDFGGRAGAKVILTTEEGVFEKTPASGATSVQFDSVTFNNHVGGVVWGSNSAAPPATQTASTANGGTNPVTNIVGGAANGVTFSWAVTATTTEGSTTARPVVNKCAMTNASNFLGTASGSPTGALYTNVALPPTGNIGFGNGYQIPTVGACTFTIGSTVTGTTPSQGVYYSTPPGGTPQAMPSGGLDLQLRDVQGTVIETLLFNGGYGASAVPANVTTTAGREGVGYAFVTTGRSNPNSVYDVVVSRQPTGQTCIVHNGGAATLGVATSNITNAHVACRVKPTGTSVLRGTYEFFSGETFNYPTTPTAGIPASAGVNNNGTLTNTTTTVSTIKSYVVYTGTTNPGLGGHSKGQNLTQDLSTRVQVTTTPAGSTTSTPVSDTTTVATNVQSTNTVITRNFLTFFDDGTFLYGVHGNNQVEHGFYNYNPTTKVINFTLITDAFTVPFGGTTAGTNQSIGLTNGLSGTIPTAVTGVPASNPVTFGGVSHPTMTNVTKVSGTVSRLSGEFGPVNNFTTVGVKWAKWSLVEPGNVAGQMAGTWVTPDHRRAWNYDFNTTLGFHVGVNGGAPNMQDGCFTFQDYRDPNGFYTRRGGLTGCLDAVSNPAGIGTVDYQLPTLANTPGFVGRMPGTETAFDGRSPSPIYYAIGTAATFATVADPVYFGSTTEQPTSSTALTALCGTADVLGVRASLNGNPINRPVYMCREKAN
jgi:hypothetical protein